PAAEETGAIVPIGTWVLEEACRQVRQWGEAHPTGPPLRVSVNLSPRQLARPQLTRSISAVFARAGVSPSSVCLEVTEGAVMEYHERAIEALGELRQLGVGLAIDDFGTGYSSLSYLKRFRVAWLNIDRCVVAVID